MDIGSTSSYVSKASSNKGVSGIASGMDTEGMVEAMLANTQAKIDKQNGLKQQIEWKQEIYRDIITQLNSFQSTYFGSSSSKSLLNASFFNAMSAIANSPAFKVSATSNAAAGNTKMQVRQLAANTSITSGSKVSGKLEGTLDAAKLQDMVDEQLNADYKVAFKVGDQDVTVDMTSLFVDGSSGTKTFRTPTDDEIAQTIHDAFDDKGIDVTAKIENGALTITGADPGKTITVQSDGSSAYGLKVLGLTGGTSSRQNTGKTETSLSGKRDMTPGVSFNVTLDDLQKEIKLDLREITDTSGKIDAGRFRNHLQTQLDKAHGTNEISVAANDGSFELLVGQGRKVMVGGDSKVLEAMGFKNGQSNRIGLGGSLKDLYFAEDLQGGSFRFNINGQDFSFTENDTVGDIINQINKSDAGVRIVYKAQDDKFVMETSESGAGREITMSQTEGNFLNALFGSGADGALSSGKSASSNSLVKNLINKDFAGAFPSDFKEGGLTLTVNGADYQFSLPKKTGDGAGDYTQSEIVTELNNQFKEKLGENSIEMNADGSLSVKNGAAVSVKVNDELGAGDLGKALFGDAGATNEAGVTSTLGDLGFDDGVKISLGGGGYFSFGAANSVQDILDAVNVEGSGLKATFRDGKLNIASTGTAGETLTITDTTGQPLDSLFGSDKIELGVVSGTAASEVKGQNAIVVIDGLETERSSNNFSVNGLNITLQETTGSYVKAIKKDDGTYVDKDGNAVTADSDGYQLDADGNRIFEGTTETISTTRNTDQIIDGIKGFIDEYNKIVKSLNELIDADASYKKYDPLTDAQKKEMSEKEIELWEEKAKTGLLRRDSTLDTFLQSMRSTMYEKQAGSGYAIYNLGIETGDWESKGQLVLSDDGEAQLRQMVESDPNGVLQFFTDSEDGLATKLNSVLDKTAKISSGSPGSLVSLAGVKGKASETQNTLYGRLLDIDSRIETLKNTYEKEKTRYWKQFNTMEQLISNMNTQSSWLSQQLSM